MFDGIKNIFGSDSQEDKVMNWNSIDWNQFNAILLSSNRRLQVIYKHSTRCATSYFALKNIQMLSEEDIGKADFYLVNVIGDRELSQKIARELGVRHESPQVIILKGGEVQWHGSHQQVQAEIISSHL
ncbi:bacillithiol system redox-active protein YtxJ [Gracilimonas tropica]|uniref:bacillithiol system redox-active protein YtxJ n=1 Tax=Gracilimonas tropica TaxID=454600 RepID=UPI00036C8683|nr:bacillithiol system redox-active protein YtxJ [Gracilimonas tropica]